MICRSAGENYSKPPNKRLNRGIVGLVTEDPYKNVRAHLHQDPGGTYLPLVLYQHGREAHTLMADVEMEIPNEANVH